MPKAITIKYKGRTQTIAAWADECGLDRGIIYARLRKGFSVKDVLTKPKQDQSKRGEFLTYKGKSQTLTRWAAELDISVSQLWRRIKVAGDLSGAIDGSWRKGKGQGAAVMVEFVGRTQSYSAWAREYDMPPALLFSRLHAGWSLEKALTTPNSQGDAEKLKFNGRYYTKRQVGKKLGITVADLNKFIEMGVDPDEIAKVVGR